MFFESTTSLPEDMNEKPQETIPNIIDFMDLYDRVTIFAHKHQIKMKEVVLVSDGTEILMSVK